MKRWPAKSDLKEQKRLHLTSGTGRELGARDGRFQVKGSAPGEDVASKN